MDDGLLTLFKNSNYQPKAKFGQPIAVDQILVLAPHPDDEVLGCGGTLLRYCETGANITICYLTDGRYGVEGENDTERKTESRGLKKFLPRIQQIYQDVRDGALERHIPETTRDLHGILHSVKPQLIFVPWMLDAHRDHSMTALILARALSWDNYACLISSYEVMYPLFANHFVNITEHIEGKDALIGVYESQIRRFNVLEICRALNQFRACLIRRSSVLAAEGFYTIQSGSYTDLLKCIFPREMNY